MYDNPHPMDNLVIKDLMQRFKRPVNKEYIIDVTYLPSETKFISYTWGGTHHLMPLVGMDITWEMDTENVPF